jgi:thimet oligopeptidase
MSLAHFPSSRTIGIRMPHSLPSDPEVLALTAEGVTKLCDEALVRATELADGIRALKDADEEVLTWDATFGTFDALCHALSEAVCIPQLYMVTHPDAAVRDAAATCEPKVDAFGTALLMDEAIASVLKRSASRIGVPERRDHARLVEFTLRDYRRNGLELPPEGRERLRVLNEEITKAGQAFEKNLASTLSIQIKPEQLEGLPASYIAAHPAGEDGLIRITTDYPDYVPFMKYAKDRAAARELYFQSNNRATEQNLPLLDTILKLRHEKALLLGYATWADYVLEPRMARNAANVRTFLDDLHAGLKQKREEEFVTYRKHAEQLGILSDGRVLASDAAYLEDLVLQDKFTLDSQKLSEYFEIRAVQQGLFDITSELYGISYRSVAVPVWHADVQPYDVLDTSGAILGRVYLDLYPREHKYKHAAVFGMRETMRLPDGSRLLPIGALVCNFSKPDGTPALLSHDEVTTFFHEFGHLLHHILSTSELARFAGTGVARDFVEAPSQMFEEWTWRRETLDRFARHYKTGAPLPDELFNALQASRTFGEGLHNERQLFLANLDQYYHTHEPGFDTTKIMEELHPEFSPFARIPGTHFQGTFGHLVGYDAAYYGYQWARSLSFDLLTRFEEEGMMNTKTAQDYRQAILEVGGSDDETALVIRFLGRAPTADAYKKFLQIS